MKSYKTMKVQKKLSYLRKPKKLFREGSKTGELAFMLLEKGFGGYLTDHEIKNKICRDLMIIENRYERSVKVSMRIRALIRDIRFKFGVWIARVWLPKEENFVWKVVTSRDEFNQLIAHIQSTIDRLENVKSDFIHSRDSEEYKERVRKFFETEQL